MFYKISCCISFLIFWICFILYNYINSTDNIANPNIDLKNFNLGYVILDAEGNQFPDHDRLFKISAMYTDISLPKDHKNITRKKMEFIDIPAIKCNEYKNNTLHKAEFDKYYQMYYSMICLDTPNVNKILKM